MNQYQALHAAMVLEPVNELSDDNAASPGRGPEADPKAKAKAKGTPKPKPKKEPKKKEVQKEPKTPEKSDVGSTTQVMKRPAGASASSPKAKVTKKKPAAEVGKSKSKEISVTKGYYKRDGVYELKVNGSQVLKVFRLQVYDPSTNPEVSIFQSFNSHIQVSNPTNGLTILHTEMKPADYDGLDLEKQQSIWVPWLVSLQKM